jgi:hypothetical protein
MAPKRRQAAVRAGENMRAKNGIIMMKAIILID